MKLIVNLDQRVPPISELVDGTNKAPWACLPCPYKLQKDRGGSLECIANTRHSTQVHLFYTKLWTANSVTPCLCVCIYSTGSALPVRQVTRKQTLQYKLKRNHSQYKIATHQAGDKQMASHHASHTRASSPWEVGVEWPHEYNSPTHVQHYECQGNERYKSSHGLYIHVYYCLVS